MIRCSMEKKCDFLTAHDHSDELRDYFTGLYCAGNFNDCARYRAAARMGSEELVPDEIFPNEDDFRSLFSWASIKAGNQFISPPRQLSMS